MNTDPPAIIGILFWLAVFGAIGSVLFGAVRSNFRRRCPRCAEWISKQAEMCPHCHLEVVRIP